MRKPARYDYMALFIAYLKARVSALTLLIPYDIGRIVVGSREAKVFKDFLQHNECLRIVTMLDKNLPVAATKVDEVLYLPIMTSSFRDEYFKKSVIKKAENSFFDMLQVLIKGITNGMPDIKDSAELADSKSAIEMLEKMQKGVGIDDDEFALLCEFDLEIDMEYTQEVVESIIDSFRVRLPVARLDNTAVTQMGGPIGHTGRELPEDYSPSI